VKIQQKQVLKTSVNQVGYVRVHKNYETLLMGEGGLRYAHRYGMGKRVPTGGGCQK